jgi:hypothetical protein
MWLEATRVSTAPGRGHFTTDGLAGRDNRKRPRGGDTKCGHRFADDVLPQHRPERGAAVAVAGERRRARAFELDVAAQAIGIDDLAQQNSPPIAELRHESSKLVAGVGQGERLTRVRHTVAGEDGDAFWRGELVGIEPKVPDQRFIQPDKAGRGNGGGW